MSRLFFPRPFTSLRLFSTGSGPAGKIRLINTKELYIPKGIVTLIREGSHQPLLVGGGLWLLLLAWNWPLAIAIASGTLMAIVVYLYQIRRLHVTWFKHFSQVDSIFSNQRQWQERLEQFIDRVRPNLIQLWSRCWRQGNRHLTIALLVGGVLASAVATIALIYQELHSKSLILVLGVQFILVAIMGWSRWEQPQDETASQTASYARDGSEDLADVSTLSPQDSVHAIDQLWSDLTSKDTAVRLIAIYRSVHWVQTRSSLSNPIVSTSMDAIKLTACFRVMLSHETNPSVQKALRDGLMSLQESGI